MARSFVPPSRTRFTAPTSTRPGGGAGTTTATTSGGGSVATFSAPEKKSSSRPVAKKKKKKKSASTDCEENDENKEPSERLGEWEVLYAKKGRKKRPTWIDGTVKREASGAVDYLTLVDESAGGSIARSTVPPSQAFGDKCEGYEDHNSFSGFQLQIMSKTNEQDDGGCEEEEEPPLGPIAAAAAAEEEEEEEAAAATTKRKTTKSAPPSFKSPFMSEAAGNSTAVGSSNLMATATTTKRRKPEGTTGGLLPFDKAAASSGDLVDFEILESPRVALRASVARKLRPHQLAGVKFLYECLSGLKGEDQQGCILADEMGLGKTLTTLTALRLLARAAVAVNERETERTRVRRAVIVCPATLVRQWPAEDKKWFGAVSSNVSFIAAVESAGGDEKIGDAIRRWASTRTMAGCCCVLTISYESFSRHAQVVAQNAHLDFVVFDEGHRLKSGSGVLVEAVRTCRAKKRLLITGTPCMNNLDEFFALSELVNPGRLGTLAQFRKRIAQPATLASRRGASESDRRAGREALSELRSRASAWMLRRTASEIERKGLPSKTEHFVCCSMSPSQCGAYVDACDSRDDAEPLNTIRALQNIATRGGPDGKSAKLDFLETLLQAVKEQEGKPERCVVVSNSTQTLDAVGRRCSKRGWATTRLDGSTPAAERKGLVDAFNRGGVGQSFVFLLSARAGGTGINLVGASRLVLVDLDWNPAVDEQALARVWRDGQRRPVHVYRLLATGTIDERIYQRQLAKHDVADGATDQGAAQEKRGRFDAADLARLFDHADTRPTAPAARSTTFESLSRGAHAADWPRYRGPDSITDLALRAAANAQTNLLTYWRASTFTAGAKAAAPPEPTRNNKKRTHDDEAEFELDSAAEDHVATTTTTSSSPLLLSDDDDEGDLREVLQEVDDENHETEEWDDDDENQRHPHQEEEDDDDDHHPHAPSEEEDPSAHPSPDDDDDDSSRSAHGAPSPDDTYEEDLMTIQRSSRPSKQRRVIIEDDDEEEESSSGY